ncbi:hypothetical protein N7509_004850 [Penicillium cosmopolitanum]|uniref:Uncharacterized protein n=1 Tax=Penicillium cosmopolitanum TaxID=1131564 RepID=A0A9X0B9J4_9EURO|nr:uncharacterized protein N7509_004850 [Penicillium cosmopolitanum]KAJ5396737.1 hypothetical protein N7509_004850 [Penicillium cosmopolitanum]
MAVTTRTAALSSLVFAGSQALSILLRKRTGVPLLKINTLNPGNHFGSPLPVKLGIFVASPDSLLDFNDFKSLPVELLCDEVSIDFGNHVPLKSFAG